MLKKIIYILLVFTTLCFNYKANSYNIELAVLDEGKSIKELKENIEVLDKASSSLNTDLKNLNTDYKLKDFLRNDLTIYQTKQIRKLSSEYSKNKKEIESVILQRQDENLSIIDERKLLIEEKRKFYIGLIPYINIDFKEDYLDYIKIDAEIINEQSEISANIVIKKEILSTKVENIENKIKEHNKYISESINNIIETRLEEKINNLNENDSFKNLNSKSKIKVINKTIDKIKIKIDSIENMETEVLSGSTVSTNNTLTKNIEIYYIALKKLEEFRDSFK